MLIKRYAYSLSLLLLSAFLCVSCLDKDENEFTLYDDTAITSFGISAADIYKYTKASDNKTDSMYVESSTEVARYPFNIDHVKGLIYNTDSLPKGTDATKLLCTYSTINNGIPYIVDEKTDSMRILSATDSTDFSFPRRVDVFSSDFTSRRTYTIKVNVHQEVADSFKWSRMADVPDFAAMDAVRCVYMDGKVFVAGKNAGNTYIYYTSLTDGNSWTKSNIVLGSTAYDNMVAANGNIWFLDGTAIRKSPDGECLETVAEVPSIRKLAGGNSKELYALSHEGNMMKSSDGGNTWTEDIIDDKNSLLPYSDMSCCVTKASFNKETDYILIAGSRDTEIYPEEKTSHVWRKIINKESGDTDKWSYIPFDSSNLYPMPRISNLSLIPYGNSFLAFGGAGIGGCDIPAYSTIYESRDWGITWKKNSIYHYPADFDKNSSSLAVTVDSNSNIWLICSGTGNVWRGRLNRMGWIQNID
ncbi:DUF6242 domain-containing protein [Xylanibacter muris]|uniref:Exo-alpha-sialidase n=1 Tax=Xylanibacter muris TaxID=2736290 RepID=A0ABX2ALA5_9BACT|nr:DUF6242 domain-containing protein [Xylanibacter muris]NPD91032.1 hypothetical protein [Xylanibacter muris]